jgi:hypothetical protein
MSNPQSENEWPTGLHIKRLGAVFIVFHGRKHICAFQDEAAAECALKYWEGQMVIGMAPGEWNIPLAQACLNATLIAKTEKAEREGAATKARLAAAEERLATNPPARPGWGVAPLPSTLAGRVAAVMRQACEPDTRRREFERQWRVQSDKFKIPERPNLGEFGLSTLTTAFALARG